ncbi:bifunctional 3'-5' exonuclease/DNA polymerase, partial [Micromonospora sp. NPDC023814]
MLVAVVSDERGGGALQPLDAAGAPVGPVEPAADLAAAVAARERAAHPRWVWASGATVYPALLRAGVRVERCHDVELTEALLLGHAGRWGEPRALAAAWARLTGAAPSSPGCPGPEAAGDAARGVVGAAQRRPAGPAGPGVPTGG